MSITFAVAEIIVDQNRKVWSMTDEQSEIQLANSNAFRLMRLINMPEYERDYCGRIEKHEFPMYLKRSAYYQRPTAELFDHIEQDRRDYEANIVARFHALIQRAIELDAPGVCWG